MAHKEARAQCQQATAEMEVERAGRRRAEEVLREAQAATADGAGAGGAAEEGEASVLDAVREELGMARAQVAAPLVSAWFPLGFLHTYIYACI